MKNKQAILVGAAIGGVIALSLVIAFFAGMWLGRAGRPYNFAARGLNGHGVVGVIDAIGKDTLVVKDSSLAIKTILIGKETRIRHGFSSSQFSDLKIGQKIIVLGNPQAQEAAIKAKVVRIITKSQHWLR